MNLTDLKYLPKTNAAIAFLLLFLLMMILLFGRNPSVLRFEFLENTFRGFYSHISNLSISCLIMMVSGYMLLLVGSNFKGVAIVGLFLILINVIAETKISTLNTVDVVDLIYGVIGVSIGMLFLLLIKKFGLQPNTLLTNLSVDEKTQQEQQQQQ